MKSLATLAILLILAGVPRMGACAGTPPASVGNSNDTNLLVIDLPTALQLAGARDLDIGIAKEKLAEARANEDVALWQFFPAIVPGVGYRKHDNLIQDVSGKVIDVHKDSYTIGPAVAAQLDFGDAIYKRLAARRLVGVAQFALESQRLDSTLAAARGYFGVAKSQNAVRVQKEAVRLADELARQINQAVEAGIAFKGDAIRAEVQIQRNRLALRQAEEQVDVAIAELTRELHLDPKVRLVVPDHDLVPLGFLDLSTPIGTWVAQALATRPELKQSQASVSAAREVKKGATYGPLVPSLGAQVFLGGLGGGIAGQPGRFGESEDYQLTLGWRIGPGGLLDEGRVHAADARLKQAQLSDDKWFDKIRSEVVAAQARLRSLSDQLALSQRAVDLAQTGYELSRRRKEFAVGVVLEQVQAEQDLTRARLDYFGAVADFDLAQYEAQRALGGPVASASVPH